ncbi:lipopolysaccharide assembly protein LapA domain-containing protein [Alkanindiges sp. WGS2144]|uniref:lipopolysaccharide assembly protein LapA domain-containing protein n=1 Tax=Alkanindiges sp. WGS2144 TaxID=3366808 RepID=UPI0037501094
MRYVLIVLLIVLFGYALALVLQNSTELQVDLLFTQVPQMRAGLLLLLTLVLGVVIGLLLGVIVFKVFQRNWEIQRLNKEIEHLRQQQIQAASTAAMAAQQEKTVLDVTPTHPQSPL